MEIVIGFLNRSGGQYILIDPPTENNPARSGRADGPTFHSDFDDHAISTVLELALS
jgi:hypothetical protein